MSKRKTVVVDGANVAFVERSKDGKPKVSNLVAVRRALEERGFRTITIVDAALRHKVDDPDQLEGLIDSQTVRQAPAGTDADFFVVKTAEQQDALIVSNDRFKELVEEHPWIRDRQIELMIIDGEVTLHDDTSVPTSGASAPQAVR